MDCKQGVACPPPSALYAPGGYQPPPVAPVQQAGQGKPYGDPSPPCIAGGNGPLYPGTRVQAQVLKSEGGDEQWHQGTILEVQPLDQAALVQFDDLGSRTLPAQRLFSIAPPACAPMSQSSQIVAAVQPVPPQWGPPPPHAQGPPQQMMGQPDVTAFLQTPSLFVRQRVDYGEVVADLLGETVGGTVGDMLRKVDISNTYDIYLDKAAADSKQRWMFAKEESDACTRYFCPRRREFKMRVGAPVRGAAFSLEERLGLVTSDRVVPAMHMERPCFCCLSEMSVHDGRGRDIGRLEEECTNLCGCCPVRFTATSKEGTMEVKGPTSCWIHCCMPCPCRDPYRFEMKHTQGSSVGTVSNIPNGCCKMCFTSADDYEINFAPHATADQRALLVAAMFALDYAYFESKNTNTDGF